MKRLTKSIGNKMICGVCSGVAEFFGIDPTIVRVAWVALGLCFGAGIVAYLACAIIMPNN